MNNNITWNSGIDRKIDFWVNLVQKLPVHNRSYKNCQWTLRKFRDSGHQSNFIVYDFEFANISDLKMQGETNDLNQEEIQTYCFFELKLQQSSENFQRIWQERSNRCSETTRQANDQFVIMSHLKKAGIDTTWRQTPK